MAAARRVMLVCLVIRVSSQVWCRSNTEPVTLLLRPRHALLMVALPDLRPWTAEDIGHSVLERLAGRHRRGMTLNRETLRNAFHDRKRFVGAAEPVEVLDNAKRLHERFRIVQHDFRLDTAQLAVGVFARRVYLDGLEFVAELETAVRNPTLNIRRPGDQRFAVPEPDRLTEPLWHVGPEPRYDTFHVEVAADVDLRGERLGCVANVQNEFRCQHEIDTGAAILRKPAHKPFRPAVRTRPLRCIAPRVVIHLLDEPLLVLGRE